jgi:hypothetical protein
MSKKKYPYSFEKGWSQRRKCDEWELRTKLSEAMNLKIENRMGWSAHLRGIVEPKVSEAIAIEAIFAEYGITEVWGSDE